MYRSMCIYDTSLTQFFLERDMFQTEIVEKIKTYFMFGKHIPCRLWDNVEKYSKAGQAMENNMVHAFCLLDN